MATHPRSRRIEVSEGGQGDREFVNTRARIVQSMAIEISNVSYSRDSVDGDSATTTHGRLLFDDTGIYFIHGWDTTQNRRKAGLTAVLAGGSLLVAPPDSGNSEHAIAEGQRLLAEVASLPPAEQHARIQGSMFIARDDIDQAKPSWLFGTVSILTQRLGERYAFKLPRGQIAGIRAWLRPSGASIIREP
ncbi:MAG: hypothetical protein R6X02_32720 [Enhygromyxa sp.]